MKPFQFQRNIISCLMLIALIAHWKAPVLAIQLIAQQPDAGNGWMGLVLYMLITSVLFVVLNLMAAIGLITAKKWCFNVSYLAILCSTLAGINYLPLSYNTLYRFFLSKPSIIPMIFIHLIFLSYVIYLDIASRKIANTASEC